MTLRGRLTLVALVALAFGSGLTVVRACGEPVSGEIAVSSAPPVAPVANEVPSDLLALLPPGARAPVPGEPDPRHSVRYTLDPDLTARVRKLLRRGRVALGHVIVLDPSDGRVLVYESTDPAAFPAERPYPAASLMKIVTAAAALHRAPEAARRPCRYSGSPYRLTRALLDPPGRGRIASLRHALSTSNNQCFARIAVHDLGYDALHEEMLQLGLLTAPGPGHAPGSVEPSQDPLALGKLGSGLAGSRITPLAAARLAATLAEGRLVTPHWVSDVIDVRGSPLLLPAREEPKRVWSGEVARELREMLVDTTTRGTARRAFRDGRGRARLGPVRVSGKTGSLTGFDPDGRYEWFAGVAPADRPSVAVATLVVHGDLYWRGASQLAAEVFQAVFCADGPCDPEPRPAALAHHRAP